MNINLKTNQNKCKKFYQVYFKSSKVVFYVILFLKRNTCHKIFSLHGKNLICIIIITVRNKVKTAFLSFLTKLTRDD